MSEKEKKQLKTLRWQADEFNYVEKSIDWFWIMGTIFIGGAVWAFIAGNWTLGLLLIVSTVAVFILGARKPKLLDITLNKKYLTVGERKYRMDHYDSFRLKTETAHLILKHSKGYYPVLIVPIQPDKPTGKIRIVLEDELDLEENEELDEPFMEQLAGRLGL